MKEIFDWLREQFDSNKEESQTRMYRLIDEDMGNRCVYSEIDVEEFATCRWIEAISLLDEAEAKWKEDCCEWTKVRFLLYPKCRNTDDNCDNSYGEDAIGFKFCPECGKRIKIVEVE